MTTSSNFDPLHPKAAPAAEDQPFLHDGDDPFAGLEGMVFSPFLTADDLSGKTWNPPSEMAEMEPRSIYTAPQESGGQGDHGHFAGRIESAENIEKLPGASGSQTPSKPDPESYGNLADVDWLKIESRKPIEDAGEEGSDAYIHQDGPGTPAGSAVGEALFTPLPIEQITALPANSIAPDRLLPAEARKAETNGPQPGAIFPAQNAGAPDVAEAPVFAPPWEHETESHEIGGTLSPIDEIKIPEETKSAPLVLQEGLTEIVEATAMRKSAADASENPAAQLLPVSGPLEREDPMPAPAQLEVSAAEDSSSELPLFHSFYRPVYKSAAPTPTRIPNFGHSALLATFALVGGIGAILIARFALNLHLFGVNSVQEAASDVHYTIGSMVVFYLITFGAAALIFPIVWEKRFLAGLQWNVQAALREFWPLVGAACVCFVLALLDEILLPGPTNAPIDQLFDNRGAAWLLFAFGVTFAPFFEETIFRGFLLPTLCTAFDWTVEKAIGIPPRPLGQGGHPQWSLASMIIASICTSIPFALMHAEQTAWSLGPFLLLVTVSLVLCWARLSTRSLAASVLVHALYNLLLFSLMLYGTSGFRHMDKM